MAEAAASAAGAAGGGGGTAGATAGDAGDAAVPPQAGWEASGDEAEGGRSELEALIALVGSVRDLIPPELRQRLVDALRELLQAIRALLDWYLERLDRQRDEPAEVQDIPIL
jgi:hypothetical protein